MIKKVMVSGIQPTGKLHLGNYLGAISNWVKLQESYDTYFFIADYHALTSLYENPSSLRDIKWELASTLIALGVNPEVLFFQSDVPEHAELHLMLSMITPLSWLERVPTYKDKIDALEGNTLNTYGFLGYPLLQAADILIYRADFVPVGKDQLPHLELSRELCRRYNAFYGASFKEPEALLTQQSLLKGLDGRKMSKSYNNTLPVMADPHQISLLIKNMLTDPQRIRKTDPGNPDHCPVYEYHRLFSSSEKCHELDLQCRNAEIGCVACKAKCAENIINYLNPIQEKRKRLSLVEVKSQLDAAAKRARHRAKETLDIVKSQMGL